MISSKEDLENYWSEDLRHYQLKKLTAIHRIKSPILRFQKRLRKIEYLTNCKSNPFSKIKRKYLSVLNTRLGIRLGFTIPINTFGPGLCLPHYGTIVVTSKATVGSNCRLHPGTTIGAYHGAPTIGNNVYIGPGARIFGDVTIGNYVSVGANAVVTKSFGDSLAIGGVPAEVISNKSTYDLKMFPEGFLKQP
jgi:serine O-acetyltransferase